jgi:hypothetical protein
MSTPESNRFLAHKLTTARIKRKKSVLEIALALKLSTQTIELLETNPTHVPLFILYKALDFYDLLYDIDMIEMKFVSSEEPEL